jgi:hypothetical protein
MNGFAVRRVRIVLRSLAAVVHTVIADDTDAPEARAFGKRGRTLVVFRHGVISPGEHQDQVAGRQNSIEDVP